MDLQNLNKLIAAAIAIGVLIPGVALVSGLVKLPPDLHQLLVICGSLLAPMLVLLTAILRTQIARLRPLPTAILSALLVVAGFGMAYHYWRTAAPRIEPVFYEGYAYLPKEKQQDIWYIVEPSVYSPDLVRLLDEGGHESLVDALHDPDDKDEAARLIRRDSRPDQWRMFWQVLLTEFLLLAGFLIAAWRAAATFPATQPPVEPGVDRANP